jgi:hypothetical protein
MLETPDGLNTQEEPAEAARAARLLGTVAAAEATGDQLDNSGLSAEQQAILSGAVEMAQTITAKYPQVNEDGQLNYYFAGSLAAMLLAQTDRIVPLRKDALPAIAPEAPISVSAEASATLQRIARKVGDVDIAVLPEYEEKAYASMPRWEDDPAGYEEARNKTVLFGIHVDLSEGASGAVGSTRGDVAAGKEPARINVHGQELYITDPERMLAWKAVHLTADFVSYKHKGKLVNDFAILADGLSQVYPREELVRSVHDTLIDDPNLVLPTYHKSLNATCRAFFEEVCAADQNATYLGHIERGSERSLGVLSILNKYQTPAAKEAIVSFVNQHREQLNGLKISPYDAENHQLIAAHMRQNPEKYKSILQSTRGNLDSAEEWLGNNPWAIKYGNDLPDQTGLIKNPVSPNYYLTMLANLDESNITQELTVLAGLVDLSARESNLPPGLELQRVFESAIVTTPATRKALFEGLDAALKQLDPEQMEKLMRSLWSTARDLPGASQSVPASQGEPWFAPMRECFQHFDLPFNPKV